MKFEIRTFRGVYRARAEQRFKFRFLRFLILKVALAFCMVLFQKTPKTPCIEG